MRGHMNFVENLPIMIILTLISGLFYTQTTAWLGLVLVVSRITYILGYVANPALRIFGFMPMMLVLVTEIVLIGIGLWKMFFN